MDEHSTPAPMTTEQATDESFLAATKLRMNSDATRDLAQTATPEIFGHAGLAEQFQGLLGQFADVMEHQAATLDHASRVALDVERDQQSGAGGEDAH